MKRVILLLLFLLLILTGVYATEGIMVVPVKIPCDDSLFDHFGSRTANIQVLNLSCPEESIYVFILKGWLFLSNSDILSGKTALKLTGWDMNFEKTLPLSREGSYLTLAPQLLLLPKECKTIEVMGVCVEISELVELKLPFEIVDSHVEMPKEAGIFPVSYDGDNYNFSDKLPQNDIFLMISAGEKSTGGYFLEVNKITLHKHVIAVKATLTCPPRSAFVTQVLTHPAVMLKLPELSTGEYSLELTLVSKRNEMQSTENYEGKLIITSP